MSSFLVVLKKRLMIWLKAYITIWVILFHSKGLCTEHTLKNKYDLTLCQSRLHTASETFVHQKKFGSGSIFCVFASVACILIGKDGEYEKKRKKRMRKFRTQCEMALTRTSAAKSSSCVDVKWNQDSGLHQCRPCPHYPLLHTTSLN